MARWRLTAAHYLNLVDQAEWEYKETNRDTGRQAKKVFLVPTYLHPDEPTFRNRDGEIIVCRGKGQSGDHEFKGDPTPDMEPLDDEAEAISAALRPSWIHPIESLGATGTEDFAAQLIKSFEKQMNQSKAVGSTSLKGIDPEAFAKLQEQVAQLTAQLAAAKPERRV